MLGSQQFCVRWNSYQTNLQDVFPKLLNSEHFVDVTLACEAQMIKCHKVVLSACSTYFEQLLVQNPCQHPIIFMKDMKHWEVQALVDFMYKGEVNVSQDEISTLLKAAEALQIRGLCGADRQQDSNAVSLPPETTVSDSGGRETPPAKRRKFPEQHQERSERQERQDRQERQERKEKQQSAALTSKSSNPTPNPLGTSTPTSSNNDLASVLGVSGPIVASVTSAPLRDTERNSSSKETHSEESTDRSNIKRENFDQDDSYFDNDGDYDSFDMKDDSNSMNPDISMPTSPLDQAGPSGMQESKPTAGVGPSAHFTWLPRVAAVDHHNNIPDSLRLTQLPYQESPQLDGSHPSHYQDVNNFSDINEYNLAYGAVDEVVWDIPGGPVNLVDGRRARISKFHSDAEKRERKLVLARLRQKRFREKMKMLRVITSEANLPPSDSSDGDMVYDLSYGNFNLGNNVSMITSGRMMSNADMQHYLRMLNVRQVRQYSQENLDQAVADMMAGRFKSVRACARHYGVPLTTLHYRIKNRAKGTALAESSSSPLARGAF